MPPRNAWVGPAIKSRARHEALVKSALKPAVVGSKSLSLSEDHPLRYYPGCFLRLG